MNWTKRIDALVGQDFYIHKNHPDVQPFIDYLYRPYEKGDPLLNSMEECEEPIFFNYRKVLYDIANYVKAKKIVECGIREGRSSDSFTRVASKYNGKVFSFDPQFLSETFVKPPYIDYWEPHELTGEEGYRIFGGSIKDVALLYIDVDPHYYSNNINLLRHYWVHKLRAGGYIVMDDMNPAFDAEVAHIEYANVWRPVRDYGTLKAMLEFLDENEECVEYCFTVFNNNANGFAVIKYREEPDVVG